MTAVDAVPWWDRPVLLGANVLAALVHPRMGYRHWQRRREWPAFATPRSYSLLMQWRKIFDHDPRFVRLSDKLEAKIWARQVVPEIGIPEVLWTGGRPEDVPDALLQPGYVLKTTHGSGHNHFPHREKVARADLNSRLAGWLRPYRYRGEWANARVRPRLFVERLVGNGEPMYEVTFRCEDGRVTTSFVALHLKTLQEVDAFFDAEDRRLPPVVDMPPSEEFPRDFRPPGIFWTAKAMAARLSVGFDYVRVDLMCADDMVYFQEMTFYSQSGYGVDERAHIAPLNERAWLEAIGICWFLATPHPWPLSLYAVAFRRWTVRRRTELDVRKAARSPG